MPRSNYIYLVRYNACGTVLGAFTVKREAQEWALRESGHPLEHLQLSSIKDGVWADKTEKPIPWETTGLGTSSACKPRHKKYGIEQWSEWFKKWTHRQWYVTERARDQALEDLKRHTCNILKEHGHEPRYRKVNR